MRIGIDLGGTKIEGLALGDDGRELARRRIATPRGDYHATLDAVASVVIDLERDTGLRGTVGIGIPGALSPATGLVKNANSTWLIGRPLDEDVSRRLDRPVRVANDANCFALSEATDGAAAGAAVVFGVIIGTGTGGAIVANGRLLVGANAIAGEWGHNPLPPSRGRRVSVPGAGGRGAAEAPEPEDPPACYCGRVGCIETYLSGPALAREYAHANGVIVPAHDVAVRARAGDPAAAACLDRYVDRLARSLASVINVVDPEVVVLGGGLSNIAELYTAVPARWSDYVFSDRVVTRLVRAKHGDASGVRGAAWLWGPDCDGDASGRSVQRV